MVAAIEYGVQRIDASSKKRTVLEEERDRHFGIMKVFPWTAEASKRFGSIQAGLERDGVAIDDFDIAIAAIAMCHGARALTGERVPCIRSVRPDDCQFDNDRTGSNHHRMRQEPGRVAA